MADLYQRKFDSFGATQEERFRLFAGDRQIAEITRKDGTDQTLYFHPDHLGSPETLSDANGAAYHERFDPFGAAIGTPSPELTRVGFTGQDHDNDLGLIDMKGRVYDPLGGRFMTADPVMQAPFWSQGLNRYSYVFNNPINNVDPSGFDAADVGGGIVGGGVFTGHVMATAAILDGFGVGFGAAAGGLGIGGLNPLTSIGSGFYGIGDGSAASTQSGRPPTTAPKGGMGGRDAKAGAPGQIGPVGNSLPTGRGLQDYLRARGIRDERLAMSTACMFNPAACAAAAADAVATLLMESLPLVEALVLSAAETAPAVAIASTALIPGDSVVHQIGNYTNRVGKIAQEAGKRLGRKVRPIDVKDAIHHVKEKLGRGGLKRNPDVMVDPDSGDVRPEVPGGIGDSIGNIYDYL